KLVLFIICHNIVVMGGNLSQAQDESYARAKALSLRDGVIVGDATRAIIPLALSTAPFPPIPSDLLPLARKEMEGAQRSKADQLASAVRAGDRAEFDRVMERISPGISDEAK